MWFVVLVIGRIYVCIDETFLVRPAMFPESLQSVPALLMCSVCDASYSLGSLQVSTHGTVVLSDMDQVREGLHLVEHADTCALIHAVDRATGTFE